MRSCGELLWMLPPFPARINNRTNEIFTLTLLLDSSYSGTRGGTRDFKCGGM